MKLSDRIVTKLAQLKVQPNNEIETDVKLIFIWAFNDAQLLKRVSKHKTKVWVDWKIKNSVDIIQSQLFIHELFSVDRFKKLPFIGNSKIAVDIVTNSEFKFYLSVF